MRVRVPRFVPAPALLAGALFLNSHAAAVQSVSPPDSGSRIRVTSDPGNVRTEGALLRWSADSLILAVADADTARLARQNITELAVSRGRYYRTGKGALIGGLVGTGVGLIIGLAVAADGCDDCFYRPGAGEIAGVALIFGALGTGLGTVAGLASPGERWEVLGTGSP